MVSIEMNCLKVMNDHIMTKYLDIQNSAFHEHFNINIFEEKRALKMPDTVFAR